MGRIISISLTIVVFALASIVLFQTVNAQSSSTWKTRVGNPPVAEGLLEIGLIIKSAYDGLGGDTHHPPATLSYLQSELKALGASEDQINAFSQSYPNRLVGSPISSKNASCIQCLGFVGLVFSTYAKTSSALQYENPKAMAGLQSLSAGGVVFQRLPQGAPPQPGDIGIHGGGSYGHIAIVKERVGNVSFKALESNGNSDCRITDNRVILIDRADQYGYVFFREQ